MIPALFEVVVRQRAHAKTIQSRFGIEYPPHRHRGAGEKTNTRLSGAFFARQKCCHQNVQRLAFRWEGRRAPGGAEIQTNGNGSCPKTRRKIGIPAAPPALRIFFAPDFPALNESGRKFLRPRFDPGVHDRWWKEATGFNLARVRS